MAKHKSPSELKSKVIRVNIGDWHWLNSLSRELGITVAQAFHKVVMRQEPEPKPGPKPEPAQMPLITVAKIPVALRVRSQPTLTTNGHKAGVFVIKPKGGVISDRGIDR